MTADQALDWGIAIAVIGGVIALIGTVLAIRGMQHDPTTYGRRPPGRRALLLGAAILIIALGLIHIGSR